MPTLEDRLQKRASNQVRLVTVLYATIGNPTAAPEIGDPQVERTDKGWRVDVPFANAGETHYRLSGDVVLKDGEGKIIETIDMDSSPIHPQTAVTVGFPIQPLHDGEYAMEIHLKLGSKILLKEAALEVASK